MASSSPTRLCYLLLLVVLLLLATPTPSARASSERRRRRRVRVEANKPALPVAVVAGRARQEFHFHPSPTTGRRGSTAARGGGTGAWTFSAMLPRGFVPPSGSSACHNDMPDGAADAKFFICSGSGTTP